MNDLEPNPTDDEFVERLRRGIPRYNRWRRVLRVVYLLLTIGLVGIGFAVNEFFQVAAAWPGLGPGFAVGFALGVSFGLLAVHVAHGLVTSLLDNFRAQRLLVRYHDALFGSEVEQADEPV